MTLDGNGMITELHLGNRELTILPAEIGQLGSLERLDLYINNLSSLPAEIGELASLERLNLDLNNLSSLPIEMKQLVKLRFLDLSRNNLSQFNHVPFIPSGGIGIAVGCSTETNLEFLLLSGNPNLEVLNQCICDLDLDTGGAVDIDVVPDVVSCVGNTVLGN